MTREEAKFILANIDRRVCDDELSEALDMAIEALEQEPSEDCISREELLEQIYIWGGDTDTLIEYIKGMPSATPTQEPILDKIRAEIEKQEKWLLQAGYTTYNVDIALDAIKSAVLESEDKE